jgi:hypothetical protein
VAIYVDRQVASNAINPFPRSPQRPSCAPGSDIHRSRQARGNRSLRREGGLAGSPDAGGGARGAAATLAQATPDPRGGGLFDFEGV